jgi:diketogulonate reductase-like aldo/keto reductase
MLMRAIPSTGELIPIVGLGTWQTFDVGTDTAARAQLADVLAAFVDGGGTLVDSSPMYGTSETVVGDLASAFGLRSRLFLATKVWISGRAEGIRQMEASRRKLRADRLDLMQVHNLLDVDTHLKTLAEWKQSGHVRYIGVTHYTAGGHAAVARIVESHQVDFIQINYSAGEREAEARLLPLARDKGVAVIANRPFASGGLIRHLAQRPLPPFAGELNCRTWPQLLLKFVVSHPAITCAIPASSDAAHVRDNNEAGDGPMPDAAMRAEIAAGVES